MWASIYDKGEGVLVFAASDYLICSVVKVFKRIPCGSLNFQRSVYFDSSSYGLGTCLAFWLMGKLGGRIALMDDICWHVFM